MLHTLMLSALLMGLAGTPHCVAMCGPACTAMAAGSPRVPWAFHGARVLSYSMAGAVVAASVGSLEGLGQAVAALRPLWTLVHVAALALGLMLLWRGRQPAWMERIGHVRAPSTFVVAVPVQAVGSRPAMAHAAKAEPRPATLSRRQATFGLAWVAWPCGLLQSALLVAALANSAVHGALVMASFAVASGTGLVLGPALWWRLAAGATAGRAGWLRPTLAVRLAGAALVGASAFALGHGLWVRFLAWCVS